MRLIDADKMKELYQGCEIKGSINPILDIEPTVNAVPMSVIDDIKKRIDKEYNWVRHTDCSLCDIDIAFNSIRSFINECIREKESEE